ncbi:ATP-binding protein [Lunatibacter salilacus]|uniref:ATP-binding protein n=1 Tax=Lunatibacter salilacus TaxID=2483804 RepID=UPI001F491E8D|nr:AAA family ATPase [Lunatibacter salilacus]
MIEELIQYQNNLLSQHSMSWLRYLYPKLDLGEKLLGIKGLRGVGKTTILLQYLGQSELPANKKLYVTADHPYFYSNGLFDLAQQFYSYGGKLLVIDEVHKYSNWSRELKLIYDGFPDLRVLFTSSSALDLYRGESDLSRRLISFPLEGLSFREYLSLMTDRNFNTYTFQEILENHQEISTFLRRDFHPLPYFQAYLKFGYFPAIKHLSPESMKNRIFQTINTVLETDLAFSKEYTPSNIAKIKKLLGVIAVTVPFEPNISKIAEKLGIGRNTVYAFLTHLQDAKILKLMNRPNRGISYLQKPAKIYFENTNFAFSMQVNPNKGTIRETFFINQLGNAGQQVYLSEKGDFGVADTWTFEIGGTSKDDKQIKNVKNSYLVIDDIEIGIGNRIPLWLFGFLY